MIRSSQSGLHSRFCQIVTCKTGLHIVMADVWRSMKTSEGPLKHLNGVLCAGNGRGCRLTLLKFTGHPEECWSLVELMIERRTGKAHSIGNCPINMDCCTSARANRAESSSLSFHTYQELKHFSRGGPASHGTGAVPLPCEAPTPL